MAGLRFTLKVDGQSHRLLNRQLDAFKNDARARQKHARTIGGYVRSDAKKNIRAQKTVGGQAFTPRQASRKKAAMLRGLVKRMDLISKAGQGGGVIVSWRNPLEAGIAGRHQWGIGEDWTPQRARAERGVPDYKAPCTLDQARALIKAGYRRPQKGKPAKRMSAKDWQAAFSRGQAGLILRLLRTGSTRGKQHWRDTVPVRDFLGVTDATARDYSDKLAAKILENTRKGKA